MYVCAVKACKVCHSKAVLYQAQECSDEEREDMLGEFLTFINTLSATHKTMRSVLASDQWFLMLLKIVNVDPETGTV